MNAYQELQAYLKKDEIVDWIIFGAWGSDIHLEKSPIWEKGETEPDNIPVPFHVRGKVLTLSEAKPYMIDWQFFNHIGVDDCYATYIWTNQRIIFVSEYDYSTKLNSVPRKPINIIPKMI